MVYITGDTHGDFSRFGKFCRRNTVTEDDVVIVLGDAGLNYFGDGRDNAAKESASQYGFTLFCVHGNHELRPASLPSYGMREFCGGEVWFEESFPRLLFARDGDLYRLGGHDCVVIGGAYSVDKYTRLLRGLRWFEDEQASDEIKRRVEQRLENIGQSVDAVLSHTCPLKYEPTEVFMTGLDQSRIDKTTERWLDEIESRLTYRRWYCGHYHTCKMIGRMRFMFWDIDVFDPDKTTADGVYDEMPGCLRHARRNNYAGKDRLN